MRAQRVESAASRLVCSSSAAGATAVDAPPLPNPADGLYAGKKAVVVGAGPAGATAAMFLAQQGFTVDVFERRAEPAKDAVDGGRAYIILLIPRGQSALEELRIPLPTDPHMQSNGTVRHSPKGTVSVSKESGNVCFSRSQLAQFLIDEARSRYPGRITFNFDAEVETVDLDKKKIKFGALGGGPGPSFPLGSVETRFDLLVGADGINSKIRSALVSAAPPSDPLNVDVSDSGREYKVYLSIPGDIEPAEFKGKPGTSLHLFTTSSDAFTTFTAHSNPDGTYSGTFSLRTGGWDELKSQADYEKVLREKFKGIPEPWIPLVAAQAMQNPPSPAGKRIRCSRLWAPGVVMLGDAAHGVTPVFGQGANSALESCLILNEVMTEAKGDLSKVPQAFDAQRKADVHALFELDRKAYSFFRRRGPLDPDFLQLLSHVVLGVILSKIVPFLYGPRPKIFMLGSRTRYSEILSAVERDSKIALAFVGFVALLLAVKTVGWI